MLSHKIKNLSIRSKIQAVIFISIILITISALISIHFISKSHKEVLYHTLTSFLSSSGQELAGKLDSIDMIADRIFSHDTIQEQLRLNKYSTLNSEKSHSQAAIYNILCDFVYDFNNIGLSYVAIFQDDDLFTNSQILTGQLPEEIKEALIEEGKSGDGASKWIIDYCDTYGLFLVKEIHGIKNLNLDNLGVMIINIDLDILISDASIVSSDYETLHYLLYSDDYLMYFSNPLTESDAQLLIQQPASRYKIVKLNSDDYFNVYGKIPKYGWNFISAVPYDTIVRTMSFTHKLWIFIFLVCILLFLLLSAALTKSLLKHLSLLVSKMKLFGSNAYYAESFSQDYKLRQDEIGILHNTFDYMVTEIQSLIEKNYASELLKKEAQIKAMESQMDPHFLYNTLDSLNWNAKAQGASDISKVIIALANLLRITLNNQAAPFTIRQEIDTLNYYFTIQKMRYQKRLDYQIDIPEHLWNLEIPKLTLQPLVENSIRYGLESMVEICYISLTASIEDNDIYIDVKNNGSSFQEDMLYKLLNNEVPPNGFGVGIPNIHKRLQLTHGKEYGLTLFNDNNPLTGEEYAVVRIKLPMIVT